MRRVCWTTLCCWLLAASTAAAFDLASIERKIAKLPELTSKQPLYCLLVFGPEAETRVWLVRDGDVLYVDRNGNGDLTEPGERVERTGEANDRYASFELGDIADGDLLHKALGIYWFDVSHLKDSNPRVARRLKADSSWRAVSVHCDVAMPDFQGAGIEGRVTQQTTLSDAEGLLELSTDIETAPILHFGGPWQVTVPGKASLRIGRHDELVLVIGTPGIGPGTTVCMAYDRVVPKGVRPRATLKLPAAGGGVVEHSVDLEKRCCQINLYDSVALPEGIAAGEAELTLSLDDWPEGHVGPSTHDVKILPALPGPALFPVSSRLKSRLEHVHPDGGICSIHFSPDGTRLAAADYPGGIVHVWALSDGERLVTVDTGEGFRSSMDYYQISPDWKRIYTASHNRGTFDRVERDGKALTRVTYSDSVQVWDAASSALLHTWQQDPPRGIIAIKLSPDGRWLSVQEETPAEFSDARPRALTLLDADTLTPREVAVGHYWLYAMSADGRLGAASVPRPGEVNLHEAIAFFQLPEWKETSRVPLDDLQFAGVSSFAKDGQVAIGSVQMLPKPNDWQNARTDFKFWDVASGKTLHTISALPGESLFEFGISPDGSVAVIGGFNRETRAARLMLVDMDDWTTRDVVCEPGMLTRRAAFHPQGDWVAIAQLPLPKSVGLRDPEVTSLAQPRILLVETATGKVLETMIAPQSYMMSIALSPDGRTLATGGTGAVDLWDMTTPPGQTPEGPAVGDAVELAGTRVDGSPLEADAYRGKPTLVSFWATWCTPCVAEMPELRAIYDKLHARGFEVIGVSLDDGDADLPTFVAKQGLPWAILHGTTPETAGMHHPLARKLGVTSVPRSFLLDGEGKTVAIDPALHELEGLVKKLLPQEPQAE